MGFRDDDLFEDTMTNNPNKHELQQIIGPLKLHWAARIILIVIPAIEGRQLSKQQEASAMNLPCINGIY